MGKFPANFKADRNDGTEVDIVNRNLDKLHASAITLLAR